MMNKFMAIIDIFSIIILLFSITIHEVSHGYMAYYLGDSTAKDEGRLTLNPLAHLDLFGSIILPIFLILLFGVGFGYAKPVPINPYNFRDQKWGTLKVSIAGPLSNFSTALIFGLIIRFFALPQSLSVLFGIIVIFNFALGLFNLIPLYPLDGSHIFFALLPERWQNIKIFLQQYGLFILLLLIYIGINWIFTLANLLFLLVSGKPSPI